MIDRNRLVTFVGTGGVGKTSLAISFALEAAKEKKKVAAITVDPSNRLNTLLGLKEGMDTGQKVVFESLGVSLDVFFLNTQNLFQRFIASHVGDLFYEKIRKNSIYQQVSKNLRETHNFAALYKMVEILSVRSYDFIVLDTPPCHQVIEFFSAPGQLQNFFSLYKNKFSNPWFSWMKTSSMMEKGLKSLLGKEFVENVDQFFKIIAHLSQSVHNVSRSFIDALGAENSFLILVFSPSMDKVAEARFLQREINKKGFKVNAYLLNRAWIHGLDSGRESVTGQYGYEEALYNSILAQKNESHRLLNNLKNELVDFSLRFCLLPDMEVNLESQQDIVHFSRNLRKAWQEI